MTLHKASIHQIADWLQTQFVDARGVETVELNWQDAVLCRIRFHPGTKLEIEFADEALDDLTTSEIIADLERLKAAQRLQQAPSVRLRYDAMRQISPVAGALG